jgi:hypothetical protein
MPRHSATAISFRYGERYQKGAPDCDLRSLPDETDFFDLAIEAWAGVTGKDRKREKVYDIADPIIRGRVALLKGRIGHYGQPARIRNIDDDKVVTEHEGNLVNEPEARLVLAVPNTRPCLRAYMVVEIIQEGSLKQPYLATLRELWNMKFPDFTLKVDNVAESEAWLETAEMTQIEIKYLDQQADIADNGDDTIAGIVTSVLKPQKNKYFPKRALKLLRDNKKLAGRLVGRSDDSEEPDSISVTMEGGGRTKTFAIDQERTPMARWLFSDYGMPALSDDAHIRRCIQEVNDIMERVGGRWDTSWEH